MKPLIGITGRKDTSARLHNSMLHCVGETYVNAIQQAGGTPVILPPVIATEDIPTLVKRLDGLLLTGGEDVAPSSYRQQPEPWVGGIDEERDASEFVLVRMALENALPILGICRGHQLLNIALGGTLYQDLAMQVPGTLDHAYAPAHPMEHYVHPVTVEADSQLAQILGSTDFMVNSAHHQGVHAVGEALRVTACAPDGVIEALEMANHPFCLSVQWHPEALLKVSPAMLPLFVAFVEAAAQTH